VLAASEEKQPDRTRPVAVIASAFSRQKADVGNRENFRQILVMQSLRNWPDRHREFVHCTRWFWLVGFGQPIVTIIAGVLFVENYAAFIGPILLISMASYLPLLVFVSYRLSVFRCPRCGEKALPRAYSWTQLITARCKACGMPLS
jgi:hypothetical protein